MAVVNPEEGLFGTTDLIGAVREYVDGKGPLEKIKALLDEHPTSVNISTNDGRTPLHYAVAASTVNKKYAESDRRNELMALLVDRGANIYLPDVAGRTPLEGVTEGNPLEDFVRIVEEHRSRVYKSVPSIAPVFASRLMKTSQASRCASASFSNVCSHVLYYVYNGAVYLWDTQKDEEHVIYNPRNENPEFNEIATEMKEIRRRKTLLAHTDDAAGKEFKTVVDLERAALNRVESLEGGISKVSFFSLSCGLPAMRKPHEDCSEWVWCDTGIIARVTINSSGLVLCPGFMAQGPSRRKSVIMGGGASYPEGMVPKVTTYNSSLNYHAGADSFPQCCCCAVNGTRGVVSYVVSDNQASGRSRGSRGSGIQANFTAFEDAAGTPLVTPTPQGLERQFGSIRKVQFSEPAQQPPLTQRSHETASSSGHIFRVVVPLMEPKTGFDDMMANLASDWDPFDGCEVYDEKIAETSEALCVLMCSDRYVICVASDHLIIFDLLTKSFNRARPNNDGPIRMATCCDVNTYRVTRGKASPPIIAVVSDTLEVFQIVDGALVPRLRLPKDQNPAHEYLPHFHPTADELLVLYNSPKRQELCLFNLTTNKLSSVCRLPKPSTFRPMEKESLSRLSLALSRRGENILRYNTSMQVMSLYHWDEVLDAEAEENLPDKHLINVTFSRKHREKVNDFFAQRVVKETKSADVGIMSYVLCDCPQLADLLDGSEHDELRASAVRAATSVLERIAFAHNGSFDTGICTDSATTLGVAAFAEPPEGAKFAMNALRELCDADWPAALAEVHPNFAPVAAPYIPKAGVKKTLAKFQSVDTSDIHESKYLWNGLRVRFALQVLPRKPPPSFVDDWARDIDKVSAGQEGTFVMTPDAYRKLKPTLELLCPTPVYMVPIAQDVGENASVTRKKIAALATPTRHVVPNSMQDRLQHKPAKEDYISLTVVDRV